MKQSPIRFLWVALAVAAAIWAWMRWSGEERRIHRQLSALAEAIGKERGEGNLVAAAKANALAGLFASGFRIEVASEGLVVADRGELQRAVFAYRNGRSEVGLAFLRRQTNVGAGGLDAETTAVALLSGDAGQREARQVRFVWAKEDGEWRIRELVVGEPVAPDAFL